MTALVSFPCQWRLAGTILSLLIDLAGRPLHRTGILTADLPAGVRAFVTLVRPWTVAVLIAVTGRLTFGEGVSEESLLAGANSPSASRSPTIGVGTAVILARVDALEGQTFQGRWAFAVVLA